MTSPKELFIQKDDLRKQLGATVGSDWFGECVCFCIAQMHHEREMSADEMRGVTMFLQTFSQMHQKDEAPQESLSTGLKHVPIIKR